MLEDIVNQADLLNQGVQDNKELFDIAFADKDIDTLKTIKIDN